MPPDRFLRAVGAIIIVATAFGCRFEPLHGTAVTAALTEIEVPPIAGNAGEVLRDALIDRLHPNGETPAARRYRLNVTLTSKSLPLVIDQSTFIRRYDVHLRARYHLVEIATGRELGTAEHNTHVNHGVIPNEIYSTLVASQAALRRAADLLASVIATDAAFLIHSEQPG